MDNSFKSFLYFWLIYGILDVGNGLKCYSCIQMYPYHHPSQTGNTPQFELSANTPLQSDDSCFWGNTLNESFLVDYPISAIPPEKYTFGCVSMQIFEKYVDQDGDFNATWRKCDFGYNEATTEKSERNIFSLLEFKQGILADVARDFQDPTGKTFLLLMSQLFDDSTSLVKVIFCDNDRCKELEEEPVTESTTTQESSTYGTGAISNSGKMLLLATSIMILVVNIFNC